MPKPGSTSNRLIVGDCLDQSTTKNINAHLIFCDPPFNYGVNYGGRTNDSLPPEEYYTWCMKWIGFLGVEILCNGGIFMIACPPVHQSQINFIMRKFAGLRWLDSIVWHYTFGPNQRKHLTPSWVMIHVFSKGEPRCWNVDQIKVPSQRQLKYKDSRAKAGGKSPDDLWTLSPREEGVFVDGMNSVLESRVCGSFSERIEGHPCQMPLALMDRLITLGSNPGDLVLDPMCGSGTTLVSAKRLKRNYVGIDVNPDYITLAKRRLNDV